MGTVYEAVQENLGRRVAVKLLDPRLAEDREQLERFRREAEVVAALGHPNIVQVTDFQYDSQPPFLVMELLRGESLGSLISRERALGATRIAFIASQALSALGAAHRAGVVHRDIKPDNLFILADAAVPDTVKVLDFGIAKVDDAAQAKLTSTGAMLGTPAFMAPEQARGATDVDARADLYALGATMYQALTGRLPHEAASVPALLFAIVEKTPAPLGELRPDLPRDFVAVVERAMSKDRAARFADADAMRRALAPWSGLPASIPPPVSGDAPTVSGPAPEPHTPIVVNQTPQPVSSVDPKRGPSAAVLATIVLVVAMLCGSLLYAFSKNRDVRAPIASATTTASAFIAPASASATVAVTASAAVAATTAPSSSFAPVASAAPHRPRYGGKTAKFTGGVGAACPTCDWTAFYAVLDDASHEAALSACFAKSEHEPPKHESLIYEVHVDSDGDVTAVVPGGGTPVTVPMLDACVRKVVMPVKVARSPGPAGVIQIDLASPCSQNQVNLPHGCD
jgi:serine/threonine-protein kinase